MPCSPIHEVPQALAHPQVAATGMLVDAPGRAGPARRLVGVPIKLEQAPARPGDAPPALGEHTDDILREVLGFDAPRIAQLRRENAI